MPDWEKLVSRRLAQLALDDRERREVIAELAGHLEETYEASRQRGASHDEAIRGALLQVDNWNRLQQEIYVARKKENVMNARTSRLWIPSLGNADSLVYHAGRLCISRTETWTTRVTARS
jgi:hypothetical protein